MTSRPTPTKCHHFPKVSLDSVFEQWTKSWSCLMLKHSGFMKFGRTFCRILLEANKLYFRLSASSPYKQLVNCSSVVQHPKVLYFLGISKKATRMLTGTQRLYIYFQPVLVGLNIVVLGWLQPPLRLKLVLSGFWTPKICKWYMLGWSLKFAKLLVKTVFIRPDIAA